MLRKKFCSILVDSGSHFVAFYVEHILGVRNAHGTNGPCCQSLDKNIPKAQSLAKIHSSTKETQYMAPNDFAHSSTLA